MSRAIVSSLTALRPALVTLLDGRPDLDVDFDSIEARDARFRELKVYKERLANTGGRFKDHYDQLLRGELRTREDQERVDAEIAEDAPVMLRLDDVKAEINMVIEEINEMKEEQRRQVARQELQQNVEAQRDAIAQAVAPAIVQQAAAPAAAPQHVPSLHGLRHMEIPKFGGNILHWSEFWDSFEATYHNTGLQPIQKFNALRAHLVGEAKDSISGMRIAADSYDLAVQRLKDRFGQTQSVIDAHYNALSTLPPATNQFHKLRSTVDQIEKHLNSLTALGQNIDNNQVTISLIRAKLPSEVVYTLEQSRVGAAWTVQALRDALSKHLQDREVAEVYSSKQPKQFDRGSSSSSSTVRRENSSSNSATAGTLLAGNRNSNSKRQCLFCLDNSHWSEKCKRYATVEARKEKMKGHCFRCLNEGHRIGSCDSDAVCFVCKKNNHHTSLCFKAANKSNPREIAHVASESSSSSSTGSLLAAGESSLLQTARIVVQSPHSEKSSQIRALLDPGSQRSYVTEKLAQQLALRPVGKESLCVYVFSTTDSKEIETPVVKIRLRQKDGTFFEITASVVRNITGKLQRTTFDSNVLKQERFRGLQFADSLPLGEDMDLEVLIGTDYYLDFILPEKKRQVALGLYLLPTVFGWVLGGRLSRGGSQLDRNGRAVTTLVVASTTMTSTSLHAYSPADPIQEDQVSLTRMWDLDTLGIRDHRIKDIGDEEALVRFNEGIEYRDGRYQVGWPWKGSDLELPENFGLAVGRLNSMIRRFEKQPELVAPYQEVFENQLANRMVEIVDETSEIGEKKHYLPHHAVITPHKATTKIRVVFDGSAKARKGALSLNDCLHRGPVYLEHGCALWIRFRLNPVGFVADIEKAFLQVGLKPTDRDVTRFLWLKDPKKLTIEDNLLVLRFTRVPFGIVSSPFLLAATVQHHLAKDRSEVAKDVSKNIYVDNVVTGAASSRDAIAYREKAKEIFESASMNIREWASNSQEFMDTVPECDRVTEKIVSVLGYPWNLEKDSFSVSQPSFCKEHIITKRRILSFIASYYDPLQLFTPVFVLARIFLQQLWKEEIGWDDPLTDQQRSAWLEIASDIKLITQQTVPRFVGIPGAAEVEYSLHCFCDASEKAYGAVVYLCIKDLNSSAFSANLVFAKARLAPMDKLTLPRLELMALFIGSKALSFVAKSLPFVVLQQYLWTDSQIVLHWMHSEKVLPVFVRNRVTAIKTVENVEYRYVSTTENPADIASRGATSMDLRGSDLWWHGPNWLTLDKAAWPPLDFLGSHGTNDLIVGLREEVAAPAPEGASAEPKKESPMGIDCSKYSSLKRLLRVTALSKRCAKKWRGQKFQSNDLTAEEIEDARLMWLLYIQGVHFKDVLNAISSKKGHPLIREFELFVDENGLLRCGGRLSNSNLPESAKHPILLPKPISTRKDREFDDCRHFTTLIIQSYHERLYHVGTSHTLSQIRKEYWIPQGRAAVFKCIHSCVKCRRFDGGSYEVPKFADYPKARVSESCPFAFTGLDYLGPLNVKDKGKAWICLFTCLSTRAVHLEVVADMTSEEFLQAFQRFIARRGKPSGIWSDNAAQFKLAQSVISDLWDKVVSDKSVQSYISNQNIKWRFITEKAPWRGGFYERLIRMVKQCMKKSLGKISLTLIQLQTVVTEIESVINSRPLTYVGSDLSSGFALTPAHFLSPNAKSGIPAVDLEEIDDESFLPQLSSKARLLESWKKGQKHLERFWTLWRDEYLLSLRERSQRQLKQPRSRVSEAPRKGDIVLIKEDCPRGNWKIARIEELLRDSDGEIRSAKVVLGTGALYTRSLLHLCPLETDIDLENETKSEEPQSTPQSTSQPRAEVKRPVRDAAKRASSKIKSMFEQHEHDSD